MALFSRHIGWAVVVSELSHVFCCVLPTLITVLGALANIGLVSVAPHFILDIHDTLHAYESSIILFSAAMVCLGWGVHLSSMKVDCHDTGCTHPPCDPVKKKNARVLVIATVLFAFNLVIYFGIHRNVFGLEMFRTNAALYTDAHNHEQDGKIE